MNITRGLYSIYP